MPAEWTRSQLTIYIQAKTQSEDLEKHKSRICSVSLLVGSFVDLDSASGLKATRLTRFAGGITLHSAGLASKGPEMRTIAWID